MIDRYLARRRSIQGNDRGAIAERPPHSKRFGKGRGEERARPGLGQRRCHRLRSKTISIRFDHSRALRTTSQALKRPPVGNDGFKRDDSLRPPRGQLTQRGGRPVRADQRGFRSGCSDCQRRV